MREIKVYIISFNNTISIKTIYQTVFCLFLIKKILNNLFMVYKKTFYSYKDISEEDNFNANNSSKEINNSDIIKNRIITIHF